MRFSADDGNDTNICERVESGISLREETIIRLKPDTFHGSAPLRIFLAQFDLITRANHWGGGEEDWRHV